PRAGGGRPPLRSPDGHQGERRGCVASPENEQRVTAGGRICKVEPRPEIARAELVGGALPFGSRRCVTRRPSKEGFACPRSETLQLMVAIEANHQEPPRRIEPPHLVFLAAQV